MSKQISSSPQRYTFQAESYIKRCEEQEIEPSEDFLNIYKSAKQRDIDNMNDPEWQKENLEYDLRTTEWILDKVRSSESYAQNLYAAMCNRDFMKIDVIPILKDQLWHCSWRYAGGIIADMKGEGDYIDYYCSGIGSHESGYGLSGKPGNGYVSEGTVTQEIEADLLKLDWRVMPEDTNVV
jgi:hypothetical protein